jgi:N-methylhydantoinase A/oxoprolinase/acetone carboxylase beta subunit
LLKTGYPRQSAAFVKIAGVRTNFTIPDVHSIALGGGSRVRVRRDRTSVGPDSVGSRLGKESVAFGGTTLTVSLLSFPMSNTSQVKTSQ